MHHDDPPRAAPLHIRDYLRASADASRRGRTVVVLLVVASVLVFAGLLNSLQHQWMLERVKRLAQADSETAAYPALAQKLGPLPDPKLFPNGPDDERYKAAVDIHNRKY